EVGDEPGVSVLRGGVVPLKSRTMRGAILGQGFGGDTAWIGEATRVVLPGLRVVGQGPEPDPGQVDLMASAGGLWVGTPRRCRHLGSTRRLRGTTARLLPGGALPRSVAAP